MSIALETAIRRARLGQRVPTPPPPVVVEPVVEPVKPLPQFSRPEPITASIPAKFWDTAAWCGTAQAEPTITIRHIQRVVGRLYNVSHIDMCSHRRDASLTRVRQLAMYLCRVLTTRSTPEIGRYFGGRDHTTAIHAYRKFERLISDDPRIAAEVEAIKSTIV